MVRSKELTIQIHLKHVTSFWKKGKPWSYFLKEQVFLNENYERYIAEIERCGDDVKELQELGKYFTFKHMND